MQALCIILFAIGLCQILASPLTCFDTYLPLLQNVADTHLVDLDACSNQAVEDRLKIELKFKDELDLIKVAVSFIGDIFGNCSPEQPILFYAGCISEAGEQSSGIIIKIITVNASNLANAVGKEFKLIDDNVNACTNATNRAYVENTARLHDELDKCLKGN